MTARIDDRLLEHWQTSRRHQDEARRFLAKQRLADPRGELRALEEIVSTIADLGRTASPHPPERPSRASSPGPVSA